MIYNEDQTVRPDLTKTCAIRHISMIGRNLRAFEQPLFHNISTIFVNNSEAPLRHQIDQAVTLDGSRNKRKEKDGYDQRTEQAAPG